MAYYF